MSATPVNKPDQRANEPSMEDILASIRRIIADDRMLPLTQQKGDASQQRAAQPVAEPRQATVDAAQERPQTFESPTLRVLPGGLPKGAPPASAPPSESFEAQFGESDEKNYVAEASASDLPIESNEEDADLADENGSPLLSPTANESISNSFQSLAATVFVQNSGMIEQSMRDMLRPMLKQWLDDNLPSIVERLVRAEIERVARGPRG